MRQIFNGGGRREAGRRHSNSGRRRQGGRRRQEWKNHTPKRRDIQKKGPGENTVTEATGVEAGTSQSGFKKGHMTNIYVTDSDEEAIVDFVKDHEELYDKTSEHFKDKSKEGVSLAEDTLQQTHAVKVWTSPERDDRCRTFNSRG